MNFNDVSTYAFAIQTAINSGQMPPWPPSTSYSPLAHERVLSQEEIDLINDWVNNGTPEGMGTAPPAPVYNTTEEITNPDLVLTMPLFNISTPINDDYRCFVIPTGLSEDVYITDLEVVPGNSEAVHHALIYQDLTLTPQQLDAADPGPGYTSFGGTGSSASESIGGWVPGQGAKHYPNGMGVRLPAGANIVMQIHYPVEADGQQDQTKINIKYTTSATREIFIASPLHHGALNEGLLALPPNQESTFTTQFTMPLVDITVLDVAPHMHLLGKSISAWATTPLGETIPFIDIPDWDFHWQGFYDFKNPIRLPAGSTLHSSATYDNTSANDENPNNPPQWVYGGESTTEEMMLVFFSYTVYFPGDENIVIDPGNTHNSHACEEFTGIDKPEKPLLVIYPNPVSNQLFFNTRNTGKFTFRLTNSLGQTVLSGNATNQSVDVSKLSNGLYLFTVELENDVISERILISH